MFVFSQCVSWGVCHFYGQTIQLAVWACKWQAKFRGSTFRPGIAFTICVQISFIYRETAARTKVALKKRNTTGKTEKLFQTFRCSSKFSTEFLEQSSGDLSNCIFVNGKQPCSPSWRFRTMPMTSCNGSIFHLPRLLDFLHCCSLQMWAQRWVYRARRIQ